MPCANRFPLVLDCQIPRQMRLLIIQRALRNRRSGIAAIRARVIVPVSSPDFIGEYTITPTLCCPQYGKISAQSPGEMIEYGAAGR